MRIDQRTWIDIAHVREIRREAALRLFCRAPAAQVERGLKTLAQSWFPPEVITRAIQEREGLLVVTMPMSGPIESAMARTGQDLDLVLDCNPWIGRAWQSIRQMPQTVGQLWGTVVPWGRRLLKDLAGAIEQCGASWARRTGRETPARPPARQRSNPTRRSGQEAGMPRSPAALRAVEPHRRKQARPP